MAPRARPATSHAADPPEDEEEQTPALNTNELLQRILDRLQENDARLENLEAAQNPEDSETPRQGPPRSGSPERIPSPNPDPIPQPIHPVRDPKVAPLPEFTGKVSEFRNFMAQCALTLAMCPNTYDTNERKVLLIISSFRGTALSWARDIVINKTHPLRSDYAAFEKTLTNLYDDRTYVVQCGHKFTKLLQTKSAAAFAVEFQSLASVLELDEKSQRLMFFEKLKPTVQDNIVVAGQATTLKGLIDQAIYFDQHQHNRRQEEKKSSDPPPFRKPQNSNNSNRQGKPPYSGTPHPNPNPNPQSQSNPSSSRPHPSFFRSPLTDTERARRRANNLCGYCADPKHLTKDCPAGKTNLPLPTCIPRIHSHALMLHHLLFHLLRSC